MFLIGAVWRTQSRKVGGLLVRKRRQNTVDRVLGGACDRRGCCRQDTEWLGGILRVTEGEETGRSEQNHFWVEGELSGVQVEFQPAYYLVNQD